MTSVVHHCKYINLTFLELLTEEDFTCILIHSKLDEVAVIDEIQMLRDPQRGWAWTRALLGVVADEVHICGEPAAIDLIKNIMVTTGEDVEVLNPLIEKWGSFGIPENKEKYLFSGPQVRKANGTGNGETCFGIVE